MDKKKILITGAAGFVGSHITKALVKAEKYKIYGVDDYSGGSPNNVSDGCMFYELDLRDKKKTRNLINRIQPDVIYHLAANAREGSSFFCPIDVTERNVNVFINLIEPAIQNGIEKFLQFSSMATYGAQEPPFNEELELRPCDVYGSAKTFCEQAVKELVGAHGFKYVIIRPRNIYGENQSLKDVFRNVIGIFMNRIMREEPIYIYGDGNQKRAFSYIDFSLPCYLRCLDDDIVNDTFNIGGINPYTINEIAQMTIDCFPEYKKPEIIHLPARHGEVKYAWCTYDKAVEKLGYKEDFDVKEGIKRMAEWAKKQGPQEWTEERLPLVNEKVPVTWTMERNKKGVDE